MKFANSEEEMVVEPRSFVKTKIGEGDEVRKERVRCTYRDEQLLGRDAEDGQEDEASSHRTISLKWNA